MSKGLKSKSRDTARCDTAPCTRWIPLGNFAMWRFRDYSQAMNEDMHSYAFVFRLRRIESDRVEAEVRTTGACANTRFVGTAEHVGFRQTGHGGLIATLLDEIMVRGFAVRRSDFRLRRIECAIQ